jgi:hypothetical protein
MVYFGSEDSRSPGCSALCLWGIVTTCLYSGVLFDSLASEAIVIFLPVRLQKFNLQYYFNIWKEVTKIISNVQNDTTLVERKLIQIETRRCVCLPLRSFGRSQKELSLCVTLVLTNNIPLSMVLIRSFFENCPFRGVSWKWLFRATLFLPVSSRPLSPHPYVPNSPARKKTTRMKKAVFWVVVPCSLHDSSPWWRQQAPLKRRYTNTRLHGAAT